MDSALEQILTNSYKEGMISFMNSHEDAFEEAIELAISDKQPYAWRAAWLLWSCLETNDTRIQNYSQSIIDSLATKSDGHQRELLKILLILELSEKQEGYLFNFCATVWEKINKRPSVRLTALKLMLKIAKKHPDLSQEIIFLTQDQYMDSLSKAVKKSVYKMISELSS